MSELLDERVVEMRFDNADFEQNVNQSIKTINKLKDSLDFDNAGESFENISAAADASLHPGCKACRTSTSWNHARSRTSCNCGSPHKLPAVRP